MKFGISSNKLTQSILDSLPEAPSYLILYQPDDKFPMRVQDIHGNWWNIGYLKDTIMKQKVL